MSAVQLDLANLLRHGAAQLTREGPELAATPRSLRVWRGCSERASRAWR